MPVHRFAHRVLIAIPFLILALLAPPAHGCGSVEDLINSLLAKATSDDAQASQQAIEPMRLIGPRALDRLCANHDAIIAANPLEMTINPSDELIRLRQVIDAVARQRDAHASKLYWYTDWEKAIAAAQTQNRPILSLRLLGNLDEDRSCANSRFFRSVLYANADVARRLRENFILHWESLRPVPKLSIDFGDGRRIERTITGNSIHYVLDSKGNLIDAIPGLYGPGAFVRALESAESVAQQSAAISNEAERAQLLHTYHAGAMMRIHEQWNADMQRINAAGMWPVRLISNRVNGPGFMAIDAAPRALTKSGVELPTINALADQPTAAPALETLADSEIVRRLVELHWSDSTLDASSIALMRAKLGPQAAEAAGKLAESKMRVEDPFMRMLQAFQRSIGEDTLRNHYVFHYQIHQWLAEQPSTLELPRFNERIYAELFLTPLDDPWMGLAPADAYAALDHEGLLMTSLKD